MTHERVRAAARKRGRPVKAGTAVRPFVLRMPADLKQQLQHYVIDHPGLSLNDVIVAATREWWERVPERQRYVQFVSKTAGSR